MNSIHTHMDGAESAFFLRELEHIYDVTYDILFPTLLFRTVIPVSNVANEGAETVTYQQFERHGRAKVVGSKAKDIPRIDTEGSEFTRPVRTVAGSYAWDVQEIRAASMANRNLQQRRANATREAVEETLDEIAALGDPDNGIVSGFLNDANVAIDAATGVWNTLTADQIIADVDASIALMDVDTQSVETPTHLMLPPSQFSLVRNTPRATGSDMSIKKWIEENMELKVEKWYRQTGSGAGGVDRAVLYDRDPNKLTQELPAEFTQEAPQAQGLEMVINTHARTAGTNFYYPRSARYIDGI